MPELIGIIQEKQSKDGVKSDGKTPYTRTTFKINNTVLSTFFNYQFNVGENVDVIYDVNGQYNNISSMISTEGTPSNVSPPIQTPPIQPQEVPAQKSTPDYEASKVAGVLMSYSSKIIGDLAVAGKVEVTKIGSNIQLLTNELVKTYKEVKEKI